MKRGPSIVPQTELIEGGGNHQTNPDTSRQNGDRNQGSQDDVTSPRPRLRRPRGGHQIPDHDADKQDVAHGEVRERHHTRGRPQQHDQQQRRGQGRVRQRLSGQIPVPEQHDAHEHDVDRLQPRNIVRKLGSQTPHDGEQHRVGRWVLGLRRLVWQASDRVCAAFGDRRCRRNIDSVVVKEAENVRSLGREHQRGDA